MRLALLPVLLLAAHAAPAAAAPQVVVDRIAARIENDIITLSDVRELAAYQRLNGREPATEPELLRELIDQWIVINDAASARFPAPLAAQVDQGFAALRNQAGAGNFAARLRELDLTEADVRRLVAKEILVDHYLERKFRAQARVEPDAVERYYRDEFTPQLRQRNQPVPPLEDVHDAIAEVLLEREITRRAEQWIQQARSQLDIEIVAEAKP
jgi:parvulin-like peptidyl-prolyl isomerase